MLTIVATSEFDAIVPLIIPPNPEAVITFQESSSNLEAVTGEPSDDDQVLLFLS